MIIRREHVTMRLAAALTIILSIAACTPRPPALPAKVEPVMPETPSMQTPGGKTLLMHYMPWYETPAVRGVWGNHWTGHAREHRPDSVDTNGLPDIWSHYHPLIGLYDSTDPAVLECHLLQMKLAGVNGVVVDWYGIYDYADFPGIHAATRAMFDAAGRYGLSFAACYEDRTVDLLVNHWKILPAAHVNAHLAQTFAWMQEHWFSQPHYHRIDGRPLVLNFGPMYAPLRDPVPWRAAMDPLPVRPHFFALHHLWRQAGADGGFSWVHTDPWEDNPPPQQIINRIGEVFTYFTKNPDEAIVSAFPGFNDVYVEGHKQLDHRGGQTFRETLQVAMAGPWSTVQLVTWNDYGEGTMIEPTHEFGYTFLEILQETRRTELGDRFPFTKDDLRLPEQLFRLRKSGAAPSADLDRIAALLNAGHCAEAARRLSALAP